MSVIRTINNIFSSLNYRKIKLKNKYYEQNKAQSTG